MFRCRYCLGIVDTSFIHVKMPYSLVRYRVRQDVWTLWMEQYEDLDTLAPPEWTGCDVMRVYARREEGVYVTLR